MFLPLFSLFLFNLQLLETLMELTKDRCLLMHMKVHDEILVRGRQPSKNDILNYVSKNWCSKLLQFLEVTYHFEHVRVGGSHFHHLTTSER